MSSYADFDACFNRIVESGKQSKQSKQCLAGKIRALVLLIRLTRLRNNPIN